VSTGAVLPDSCNAYCLVLHRSPIVDPGLLCLSRSRYLLSLALSRHDLWPRLQAVCLSGASAFGCALAGGRLSAQAKKVAAGWSRALPQPVSQLWNREHSYFYEYLLVAAITVGCFCSLAFALRHLLMQFYELPEPVTNWASVAVMAALPLFFENSNHIYDAPTLLLFTLATIFVTARKHWLFLGVFVLASFNKESAILLILLFVLRERTLLPRAQLLAICMLLLAIWAAAKAIVSNAFADNPGSTVEVHLLDHNLVLWQTPMRLLYCLILVFWVWRFMAADWRRKPLFARHGFWVIFIPLSASVLLVGYIDEFRVYYEAFPFIVLLMAPSVAQLWGHQWRAKPMLSYETAQQKMTSAM
jgi:hypothetical protein